jgi:hypothetical protein
MSLKQKLTDGVVERLFDVMSSPHFMRFSNVVWRQVNDRQMAQLGASAEWQMIADRVQHLERRAGQLQAKVEALHAILERRGADGGAAGK